MSFDLHQLFQDLMREKADVMSGYQIHEGERESRTHIQVDYFCIADLDKPYMGPEQGIRPLSDIRKYNVFELEGLGRTLNESRFRYHVGRTLVMENPGGKRSRLGEMGLTIITIHKPVKLLGLSHYAFKEEEPWKFKTMILNNLPVTIIILRELEGIKGGEALAWLQLMEPEPQRRTEVWTTILDQDLTSRDRLKSIMIKIDEEAFMTVAEEFRIEGRQEGRVEGREEGRVEGREETRTAHAKKMLAKGFHLEDIMEITGLTRQEIEDLRPQAE